jgi:hypothetical protein
MLSDQETQMLAGLSQEELLRLWVKVRQARAERLGCMPPSAVQDLVKAVGDQQVRDIVNDLKGGRSEPGFLPPTKSPPVARGSGWAKPLEHGSPSGLRYVDQMCDVQDRLDKRDLERRFRGG